MVDAKKATETSGSQKKILGTRIRLITDQKKFTQGKEELLLERREVEYLHGAVSKDPTLIQEAESGSGPILEALSTRLAKIDEEVAKLEKEKLEAMQKTLHNAVSRAESSPVPKPTEALDPVRHTPGVLAQQQQNVLALQLARPVLDGLKKTVPERIRASEVNKLSKTLTLLTPLLTTAKRLLEAHNLGDLTAEATSLKEKVNALNLKLDDTKEANGPALVTEVSNLSNEVANFVARQQQAVQAIVTRQVQASEKAAQAKVVNAAVDRLLVGGVAAASPFEQKLLTEPPGPLLLELRARAGSAEALAGLVEDHEQAGKLKELLKMLSNVKENDVVQGFFLLVKDKLARPGDKKDDEFFALTQSAQGDYNSPDNIGKYTYHVTALANILREVGKGISVTGLSPSKGGLSGGSCEIASNTETFHGSNVKDASVVNSQNKVAASSNRNEAMKVYINQREDKVNQHMTEKNEGEAAKDTAIMLRFPIRAEYLGKFDKDPIHLTDNLQLLDGTPVPPGDIELLVHRQWVSITDGTFLATFREMFKMG
jgi:hypothetical protein